MSRRIAMMLAGCMAVSAQASLFTAGFEVSDTPSYVAGTQLHNVGSPNQPWNWSGSDIGVVSAAPEAAYEGDQGLAALRSTTVNSQFWWTRGANAFTSQTSGVWEVGFAVKASAWENKNSSLLEFWVQGADVSASDSSANRTNRSAWITLTGAGNLQAYTNNSAALTVATGVTASDWNSIRLVVNLDAGHYSLFLNDTAVATDYTFYGGGTNVGAITSLQFKEYNDGKSSGGVYLDNVYVIPEPATLLLLGIGLLAARISLHWRRA